MGSALAGTGSLQKWGNTNNNVMTVYGSGLGFTGSVIVGQGTLSFLTGEPSLRPLGTGAVVVEPAGHGRDEVGE